MMLNKEPCLCGDPDCPRCFPWMSHIRDPLPYDDPDWDGDYGDEDYDEPDYEAIIRERYEVTPTEQDNEADRRAGW